jgi:hypothetical protein
VSGLEFLIVPKTGLYLQRNIIERELLLTALNRLRGTGSQVEPSSVVYKRVGTPIDISRCAYRLAV